MAKAKKINAAELLEKKEEVVAEVEVPFEWRQLVQDNLIAKTQSYGKIDMDFGYPDLASTSPSPDNRGFYFSVFEEELEKIRGERAAKPAKPTVKITNPYSGGVIYDTTSNKIIPRYRKIGAEPSPEEWEEDLPRLGFDNGVPDKEEVVKDFKYRLNIQSLPHVTFLRYPAELDNLTVKELMDHYNNRANSVSIVEHLPNKNLTAVAKNIKALHLNAFNFEPNRVNFANKEEFLQKSNTLLKPSSYQEFNESVSYSLNINLQVLLDSIRGNSCMKHVPIECPSFNPSPREYYRMITTGNINGDGDIEVIAINFSRDIPGGYFSGSKFSLMYAPQHLVRTNRGNPGMIYPFFRVKVKSIEKSVELFGGKAARAKLLNKIYFNKAFNYNSGYFSSKKDAVIPIFSFTEEENKTPVKFHFEDLEYLLIDYTKLEKGKSKNKISYSKGMQVKLINDRRSNFKKGDTLTLESLTKNKNNIFNSKIVVKDDKGNTEVLLLKQIRPYGNQVIKKEEVIEVKPKSNIFALKAQLNSIEQEFNKATSMPAKNFLRKCYADKKEEIAAAEKGVAYNQPVQQELIPDFF